MSLYFVFHLNKIVLYWENILNEVVSNMFCILLNQQPHEAHHNDEDNNLDMHACQSDATSWTYHNGQVQCKAGAWSQAEHG